MITVVKEVKFQGQYLGCPNKVIIMSVLIRHADKASLS
jgi:hypothetical protein